MERNAAATPPEAPSAPGAVREEITLIPCGSTNLRITRIAGAKIDPA